MAEAEAAALLLAVEGFDAPGHVSQRRDERRLGPPCERPELRGWHSQRRG